MFFLKTAFLKDGDILTPPVEIKNINSIKIQNGIFDEVFGTADIESEYSTDIPSEWDYNTILHALFENNLMAGNVGYVVSEVSALRVKHREQGTYNWITLFEIPINDISDFNFDVLDQYCRSGVIYEFCVVPVINGIEGNSPINSIESKFDGIFIIEKDLSYSTNFETEISDVTHNQQVASVLPIGSRYPYHIKNALTNYDSGTVKGFFVEVNTNTGDINIDNGFRYRKSFIDFLFNGKPKIIKTGEGQIWMCSITGSPVESPVNGYKKFIVTTFNFEEIGSVFDQDDMYNHGFVDTLG